MPQLLVVAQDHFWCWLGTWRVSGSCCVRDDTDNLPPWDNSSSFGVSAQTDTVRPFLFLAAGLPSLENWQCDHSPEHGFGLGRPSPAAAMSSILSRLDPRRVPWGAAGHALRSRVLRTKPVESMLEGTGTAGGQGTRLAKVLTTLDLISLGVGSCVGTGMYVVSGLVAKEMAGPGVIVSFIIAAVASILSGESFWWVLSEVLGTLWLSPWLDSTSMTSAGLVTLATSMR